MCVNGFLMFFVVSWSHLMVNLLVWAPWFWFPGIPENERACYFKGTRIESQTTGPQTNN